MYQKPFSTALEFLQNASGEIWQEYNSGVAERLDYTNRMSGRTYLDDWNNYVARAHDHYGRIEIYYGLEEIKKKDENFKVWSTWKGV